jgi:nucleoside-diphosphate-sugar epimerase
MDREGVSLRLATVFGTSPRMRMDLLCNNWTHRIYFDNEITIYEPHYKRNFVGINDVARAFIHVFDMSDIFNVGLDSANMTKLELAETIKRVVNPNATIKIGTGEDPDKRNYNVSSSRIKTTGFQFRDELEPALLRIRDFCRAQGYNIIERKNY